MAIDLILVARNFRGLHLKFLGFFGQNFKNF
jgi:hypothetical protein